MRDYGVVSPKFWIVGTGKELRGDRDAQLVALYLMTSPHATATGVFHLPILYVSHEIGIPLEGASKALQRLIREDFCTYDEACDSIFVHRLAGIQVGESLSVNDKRVLWLRKEIEKMPSELLKQRFLAVYGELYHLIPAGSAPPKTEGPCKPPASPLEAPSKPGSGSGSETGSREEVRAVAPRGTDSERHTNFEKMKALYPPCVAANWLLGEKFSSALVSNGESTWPALIENARLYRAYCQATGCPVTNPKNYYVDKSKWSETWPIPTKPGAPAKANDDAAWAEARHTAKEIGFRDSWPGESVSSYVRQVKEFRDRPPEVPLSERRGLAGIKRIGAK